MENKSDNVLLKENERIDDLERNNLKIIQDTKRFCFGMDAVLLTGFATLKTGDKVLDMGTGTGIIPILLSAKTDASHFTALEIQPDSADMARRSVELNGLSDKISIVEGDIKEAA
ncbi:MAG: methyltransferase, partial [Lachnospiraceae bacterium]|nr:methyltransferase [Lachnospiraceae bacterium]